MKQNQSTQNQDTWDELMITLIEKGASLRTIVSILKPLRGKTGQKKEGALRRLLKAYSKKGVGFPNEIYADEEAEERERLLIRAKEKQNRPKSAPLPW